MNHTLIFVLAALFGLFMAFNIGGNDVANSFGTSVGAGTLTITQALLIAAIFEVSGAVIAGGEVTETIRKGIVDLDKVDVSPMQLVYIMMASVFAAALWLLFATKRGWPVSTSHSIIGGIVGASLTLGATIEGGSTFSLVQWDQIVQIVISWVLSPLLGGVVSYLLFLQIKKYILNYNEQAKTALGEIIKRKKSFKKEYKTGFEQLGEMQQLISTGQMTRDAQTVSDGNYQKEDLESDYYKQIYEIDREKEEIDANRALEGWVPMLSAFGAMVIIAMLLFKGLENMHLGLSILDNFLIMAMIGAAVWMATYIYAKTLRREDLDRSTFLIFSWMQVFTAAGFAFSHGSNDIANAIGPFVAILDVLRTGAMGESAPIPTIVMASFGVALIAGLWFIGKEVIKTVGSGLTKMHPSSGFTAELSAAGVVMLASMLGLPVSSTHILVGAILGIGLVNKNANWELMKPIALAWVITVPAAGILGALSFLIFKTIL